MEVELLEEIGLTKGEIRTYFALLELGETTVTPLSKKANVTTGKVYPILDKLMKKGLASFILKNNVRYFSAASPSRIKDYVEAKISLLRKRENQLDKIIPEIEKKIKSAQEDVKAEIFIGWKGMETAYADMIDSLNKGDYDFVLGANKGINEIRTKRFYGRILNKTYDKGIKIKVIYQEDSRKYFQSSLGETKHVNARFLSYTSPSEINIYNDTVMIVVHSQSPIVIKIRSKEVRDSFLNYYNILWKQAKK